MLESNKKNGNKMPSWRTMEKHFVLIRSDKKKTSNEAIEEAQQIIWDAWEEEKPEIRVEMALNALEVSPDCVDAYNLLAEEVAVFFEEALKLYELGVKAGERALGKKAFKDGAGHFWGRLETRPYMRARAGLAECLCETGDLKEGIEHYKDMLRLNPNDNQGLRYILVSRLLEAGEIDDAYKLLFKSEYKNDIGSEWIYQRALVLFIKEGGSEKAGIQLKKAIQSNRYLPVYLLGKKKLPKWLPEYHGFGDEDEAIGCMSRFGGIWQKTPGAIKWLKERSVSMPEVDQPGRNELCSCGSGKKYKKCCLPKMH